MVYTLPRILLLMPTGIKSSNANHCGEFLFVKKLMLIVCVPSIFSLTTRGSPHMCVCMILFPSALSIVTKTKMAASCAQGRRNPARSWLEAYTATWPKGILLVVHVMHRVT